MSTASAPSTNDSAVDDSAVDHSAAAINATLFRCDQPGCGQEVVPCSNRKQSVCTSFISETASGLCEWCQFTTLVPDLSDSHNVARWIALEAAKRRLLAELELLELPPYISTVNEQFPLSFQFASPTVIDGQLQQVITGHAEGLITINAEEADSDRREATRVALGEPQRTLIGHLRHEVGHYVDWCYAWQVAAPQYRELFGDPLAIDYEQAKQRHYAEGAPTDWPTRFVSAYASMHPWEDFAETFNAYLDLMAIAQTARDQKLADINTGHTADIARMIQQTLPVAVAISEFNTDLGLPALLPEHLSPVAVDKMTFIHRLRHPELQEQLKQFLLVRSTSSYGDGLPNQPAATPPIPTNRAQAQSR